jgi:hypothetical protein
MANGTPPWEGGGVEEGGVNGGRLSLVQMVGVNSPMGKELNQHIPHTDQGGWGAGGVGTRRQAGNIVANSLPKPKGQVSSRGATRCHL